MVDGVFVCGDGSTGSTGTACITDAGSGNQICTSPGSSGGTSTLSNLGTGFGSVSGTPSQSASTGWLSKLTGWIANAIHQVFAAIAQLLKDLVTYIIATVLDLVADAISSITPPDFLTQYSMGTVLGQAGPIVAFFLTEFKVAQGLLLIASGYGFRLLRKFLTLFQW